MTKHTQAHIERVVKKPGNLSTITQTQIEYYMGAKLLEFGMNPNDPEIAYRWWRDEKDGNIVWTYSAYWGESREKLLAFEKKRQEPS